MNIDIDKLLMVASLFPWALLSAPLIMGRIRGGVPLGVFLLIFQLSALIARVVYNI